MFKSIFTKTLYEKRLMALFWSIGVFTIALVMMSFYSSFSSGVFDEALENLPESLKGLIGDINSLKTVPGYVAQQVFAFRIPLLALIMGITLFSGLLAKDEEDGVLQSLLTLPISRTKVFIQKFAAGAVISLVITSGAFWGVLVGLFVIGEQMSIIMLLYAVVAVWLLTLVFGSIGYALSAVLGSRGVAGSISGVIAFTSYLITSFAASVPAIKSLERLSIFHYYNNPPVAESGLDAGNVALMVLTAMMFLVLAGVIFMRRDVHPK